MTEHLENYERGDKPASTWRFPLLLAAVLISLVVLRGTVREANDRIPSPPSTENSRSETVLLTIDFGDRAASESVDLAWHDGMTVADALAAASESENGLRFEAQGSGKMAFLTSLGGAANEGAGGRNWIYAVNGKRADRSFAVCELEPGDRVLWSFASRE